MRSEFDSRAAHHSINTFMQHKPNSIFDAAHSILLGEAVEISPEDMKVIKDIKKVFPGGSKLNPWSPTPQLEWDKRGGYAGEKSLTATREKLEKMGFKWSDSKGAAHPDGSTVSHATYLVNKKLGWYVKIVSFYGQTASSNAYSLTLGKVKAA